jgi:ribosomal protein L31E
MEKEDLYKKIESILDNDPELIKAFKAKYLTEAIWKRAIDQEPSLFKHAKDPSYEICLYAVKLDGTNLYDVPKSLVTTKLLKAAIKSAPSVIKYAYDEFLNLMDDQMIVDAVVLQPDLIKKVYERMDYQLIKKIASKEPLGVFERISPTLAAVDDLRVSQPVDFALSMWMMHEVPDQGRMLGQIVGLLKPGARLLLVEPKIHVSERAFEATVALALEKGLKLAQRPVVGLSSAALLERP